MTTLAVVVVVCAFLLVVGWRIEKLLRPYIEKKAKALETSTDIARTTATPLPPAEPMPASLLGLAMRESEGWAREQALAALQELYDVTRDWKKVEHLAVSNALRGQAWPKPE